MFLALLSLPMAMLPYKTWYGPVVATFPVDFSGNPYDSAVNDVRVQFVGPTGAPLERIAYYDEPTATWKAILVTEHPGKYVATLYRNGEKKEQKPSEAILDASTKLKDGYIQLDPFVRNRFRYSTGTPYYPIGFNLGWQNGDILPMESQIEKMSKFGINWTRIWACNWDGKNPWWPAKDEKTPDGELWPGAFKKWDSLITACETNSVPFQFVLFHHGLFSSKVNPNWPDHPWNAKQGGFLKDAADFFIDPEAKRRSKIWLRYAVARYAHSPSILAWELFNEVEWVDTRYANRWPEIEAWHKEMADYVRSIDPYHHLITTSSTTDRPNLWEAMDYVQPHTYPPSVFASVVGTPRPIAKPGFYGEFGPDNMSPANLGPAIRDGIIGGMLANDAGAAQFWYWDAVEKNKLYSEFKNASEILTKSGLYDHPSARPVSLSVSTEGTADLVLSPGTGWGKATNTEFNLPQDLTMAKQNGLPGYFQSQTGKNQDLFPTPIKLNFTAKRKGSLKLQLSEISKGGANLTIHLDGKVILTRPYPASDNNKSTEDILDVSFEKGAHTVEIRNDGSDWVKFKGITITDLAPQATVTAIADSNWTFMRITRSPGVLAEKRASKVTLGALPTGEGPIKVTLFDLETGKETSWSYTVTGGRLTLPLMNDSVIVLSKA